ncbi:carbonic anhydrase [Burkholderia ubonensis]
MWIGCWDSRVPAETITYSVPDDLFLHRNIANLYQPDDDNCSSVLKSAVRVLMVDHIIVCGHYGCGGVRGSLLPLPRPPGRAERARAGPATARVVDRARPRTAAARARTAPLP